MNDAPIGVFDSGLGGLTVWSELRRRLPRESLLYYGDGKNCPYGDKTREQGTEAVDFAVRRLVDRGVKLIVVACNAATAMAIDHLRAAYPIPFVGLEPAVKPAALSSRSGVIGILATAATLRGKLFRDLVAFRHVIALERSIYLHQRVCLGHVNQMMLAQHIRHLLVYLKDYGSRRFFDFLSAGDAGSSVRKVSVFVRRGNLKKGHIRLRGFL